jgi:hypothetical protein
MGKLSVLLQWHEEDPPDDAERERNERVCASYQGNRNPFIDFPQIAAALFESSTSSAACPSCSAPDASVGEDSADSAGNGSDEGVDGGTITDSLSVGSIAIVSLNSDNPDSFSFVALHRLSTGTTITFTDRGWLADAGSGSAGLRIGEGSVVWRNLGPAAVQPGTVLTWESGASEAGQGEGEGGQFHFDWTKSGMFSLSASGDQLLAYAESPADGMQFLCALHFTGAAGVFDAPDDTSSSGTSSSSLPHGLSIGAGAIALPHQDNYIYTGPQRGTAEHLFVNISTVANWRGDNSNRQTWDGSFEIVPPPTPIPACNATRARGLQNERCSGGPKEVCATSVLAKAAGVDRRDALCSESCTELYSCLEGALADAGCEHEVHLRANLDGLLGVCNIQGADELARVAENCLGQAAPDRSCE